MDINVNLPVQSIAIMARAVFGMDHVHLVKKASREIDVITYVTKEPMELTVLRPVPIAKTSLVIIVQENVRQRPVVKQDFMVQNVVKAVVLIPIVRIASFNVTVWMALRVMT